MIFKKNIIVGYKIELNRLLIIEQELNTSGYTTAPIRSGDVKEAVGL